MNLQPGKPMRGTPPPCPVIGRGSGHPARLFIPSEVYLSINNLQSATIVVAFDVIYKHYAAGLRSGHI